MAKLLSLIMINYNGKTTIAHNRKVRVIYMPLRPPGEIPGGNGGAKSFKTKQNQTQLNKSCVTPNTVKSRVSRLGKARFIPVGGAHNPEVAGSSPVSATTKSPVFSMDTGFSHTFLGQGKWCILTPI